MFSNDLFFANERNEQIKKYTSYLKKLEVLERKFRIFKISFKVVLIMELKKLVSTQKYVQMKTQYY